MKYTAIFLSALFLVSPMVTTSAYAQYSPDPYINTVIRIQQELGVLGFNPGPADGIMGKRTRAAIRRFQAAIGAPQTGLMTQQQLDIMTTAVRSSGNQSEQMFNE